MPIGDFITEGYDVVGGYRQYLEEDLSAAGSDVDFVGSLFGGIFKTSPIMSFLGCGRTVRM